MSAPGGRSAEVSRRLPLSGVADPVAAGRAFACQTLAEWGWPPAAGDLVPRVTQTSCSSSPNC